MVVVRSPLRHRFRSHVRQFDRCGTSRRRSGNPDLSKAARQRERHPSRWHDRASLGGPRQQHEYRAIAASLGRQCESGKPLRSHSSFPRRHKRKCSDDRDVDQSRRGNHSTYARTGRSDHYRRRHDAHRAQRYVKRNEPHARYLHPDGRKRPARSSAGHRFACCSRRSGGSAATTSSTRRPASRCRWTRCSAPSC